MDNFTFELLAFFSMFIYLSTGIFFWAIFKENCAAQNNPLIRSNSSNGVIGPVSYPGNPNFKDFLRTQWKSLALFGLIYLGIFGFFITHVCDYA